MAVRNDFAAGETLSADDLNDTFASKLDLAGGKILQIVRATDSTDRSTTSASYVDASISVTITPQKSDSAVLLIWSLRAAPNGGIIMTAVITDSSDNIVDGGLSAAGNTDSGGFVRNGVVVVAYATPATTSATTYKGRFKSGSSGDNVTIENASVTGQIYAIEVSA